MLLKRSPYSAMNTSCEGVVDGLSSAGVGFVAPASGTYWVEVEEQFTGSGSGYRYFVVIR